jgi:hypothetical protein
MNGNLLRADARAIADALQSKGALSDDVRTALSYWKSCEIAAERAAAQLVMAAAGVGVTACARRREVPSC